MAGSTSAAEIFRLAFPALGVLVAMPLYLLVDTAVVGHLGTAPTAQLAALGAAGVVQSVVTTQLTFLSYGTTARAARLYGQGKRADAIREGVQATWVAVAIGVLLMVLMWLLAGVIAYALIAEEQVASLAAQWLRWAAPAIPATLIEMAGNGWLRGIQNTRKPLYFTLAGLIPGAILVPILVSWWGLPGSALATVLGMSIIAGLFWWELVRQHEGSWAPDLRVIGRQLLLGRDLIVRSAAFQVAMLAAAVVAGSSGAAALAAHQVLTQLWNFLALVLDSLAVAAQALIGAALGAGSVTAARRLGISIMRYSLAFSGALAVLFALGAGVIPYWFTDSDAVVQVMHVPWWIMLVLTLAGGILFALDGVLLGAGDAAFLRTLTVVGVLFGYLPGIGLAWLMGTGLTGVWLGVAAGLTIRTLGVVYRFQSLAWAAGSRGVPAGAGR